jgi:hypothetical protein
MKTKIVVLLTTLMISTVLLQGCVGLPSLVHVEHKHGVDDQAVAKRLDSIEKRISQLEQKNTPQ